jgi:peptide/nickel transport system substrate-binding protein
MSPIFQRESSSNMGQGENMSAVEQTTEMVSTSKFSRRHFIQGAAVVGAGVALPMTGALGSSVAGAAPTSLRVAIGKIANAPTPFSTNDAGSLQILANVGEYLSWSNDKNELSPRVAESWKASAGGKIWTFKIRQGITFHDGSAVSADDVVWTFKSHLDPANKSNAAGKFKGILNSAGVQKVDKNTVKFELLAAVGTFPFLVASTSYGLLIIKNGESGGPTWETKMNGCGPFILESYVKGDRATFKKNPKYWDKSRQPKFDKLVTISFESQEAAVAQILTGKLDATTGVSGATAAKINKKKIDLVRVPSVGHLMTHLRCDFGPFSTDKRIRQAAALTLDREGFIKGVLKGQGVLGNDSVMDPFPTADKSVKQRSKDIAAAKKLMAAAGSTGFKVDLSTYSRDDINLLAPFLKSSFAEIGIDVNLGKISDSYYTAPWDANQAKKQESNFWLESNFGITDFGHRGAPAEYLTRVFRSNGDWNAAHVKDAKLDAAIDEYNTATTPAKAKVASKKIQEISLDLSAYIIPVFEVRTSAVRKGLKGFYTNGMGQFDAAATA